MHSVSHRAEGSMGGWKGINQTPVAPVDVTPSPALPGPQLKAHIYSSMYTQEHTPHNIQLKKVFGESNKQQQIHK